MSRIAKTDVEAEKQILSDFWEFRRKYYYAEDPDEFWDQMLSDLEAISKKHSSLYVDMMLLVCLADIEIRFKKKTGNRFLDPDIDQLKHVLQIYENLKGRYNEKGDRVGNQD